MAQPPAVVVHAFKPVGQLQLHRLAKRVGFRCITCRQRNSLASADDRFCR
jgi:hypothetical protein